MKDTSILTVKKWNYGDYSSANYGTNSIAIQMGQRTVYYSYDTVVSFRGCNSNSIYISFSVFYRKKQRIKARANNEKNNIDKIEQIPKSKSESKRKSNKFSIEFQREIF